MTFMHRQKLKVNVNFDGKNTSIVITNSNRHSFMKYLPHHTAARFNLFMSGNQLELEIKHVCYRYSEEETLAGVTDRTF